MIVLMKCVAEAVMNKGVRGLAELVPGATYLYDVANDALKRMKDRKRASDLHKEVTDAAAATLEEVKHAAVEVAREAAGSAPVEDRIALEMYLTQLPGAVRQSLRRAEDPSGKTAPADFALDNPVQLLRHLPQRVARFRPGDPLKGKPGWELAEFLGTGGFGEVWLARNPSFSALKGAVKFGLDPAARDRLLRHEGALVNRVMEYGRHPNVVQLLDAHLEGDAPWLMYEYVPGGDLSGLVLAWQSLPPADRVSRATAALRTLADAVGHFHRLSPPIVHRDLKPANILVDSAERGARSAERKTEDGVGSSVLNSALRAPHSALRIADFGIGGVGAEASLAMEMSRRGSTGAIVSQLAGSYTPLYAGPQQQRGEPPDPRDDVHALGVIGFQMITGKLDATLGADYAKALRKLAVPEPLVELLGDCAAHDPENRPRDAAELGERLELLGRAAPSAVSAAPPVATAIPVPIRRESEDPPGTVGVRCPRCDELIRSPISERRVTCPRCGLDFDKGLGARQGLLSPVEPKPRPTPPVAPAKPPDPVWGEVAKPKPKPVGPRPAADPPPAPKIGCVAIATTFGVPVLLAGGILALALIPFRGSGTAVTKAARKETDDGGTRRVDPPETSPRRVAFRDVIPGEWRVGPDGGLVVARVQPDKQPARIVGIRTSDGEKMYSVEAVGAFALSPDGQRVAVAVGDDVRVLNANTGTPLFTLPGLEGTPRWLGFSPDKKHLVGASEKWVAVWDLDTPAVKPIQVKDKFGEVVGASASATVVFHRFGDKFAVTNRGKPTAVVSAVDWKLVREVGTKDDRLAAFPQTGDSVLTWDGKEAVVTDVKTGQPVNYPTDVGKPSQLLVGKDKAVFVGSDGAASRGLDPPHQSPLPIGRPSRVVRAAFDPDGTVLATVDDQSRVRLWGFGLEATGRELTGHTGALRDVRFTGDGTKLFAAGDEGVFVWTVGK